MKTAARKAKGHKLEYYVRDKLLEKFNLEKEDIRANIGSETGEDLKLSTKAKEVIPWKIECKSRARMSIYTYYDQARNHPGDILEPIVIIKQNRRKPLIIMDMEYFLEIWKKQ